MEKRIERTPTPAASHCKRGGRNSDEQEWLLCDTASVVEWVCLPSTGSPFGHHPRLRIVCPLWGQWMSTWRRFASLRPCISRKSVDTLTTSPSQQHPLRDTLASGSVALQAWREYILSPSQEKRNFCCHTIITHCHTYIMHVFRYLYSQCDNVTTEKQTHKKGSLPHTLPSLGVVISATISAPADTISLSAHILIVFSNTIRKSTLTFLISTHLLQKKLKKSSEDSEDFQHKLV